MKKKNVIGHMTVSKKSTKNWFQRLDVLPRVLCLVLAVVIWLCVSALVDSGRNEIGKNTDITVVESAEG